MLVERRPLGDKCTGDIAASWHMTNICTVLGTLSAKRNGHYIPNLQTNLQKQQKSLFCFFRSLLRLLIRSG